MPEYPPFSFFGLSHIIALTAVASLSSLLIWTRHYQPLAAQRIEKLLGTCLLLIWPFSVLFRAQSGHLSWANALPLHYCDVAAFAGGIALWTHRPRLLEITYFFGLAGTLQGLLTPSLTQDFPSPLYFHFFLWHGGVVVAALHGPLALRWHPSPRAWLRMTRLTLAYGVIVGLINIPLQANYGFLCSKPASSSLMDPLGPWPWYLPGLLVVAALVYALLQLPFHLTCHAAQPQRPPPT